MSEIARVMRGDIVASTDNWTAVYEDRSKVIYPQLPNGETIRVRIPKHVFRCVHTNGTTVELSAVYAQRKWYYHDSRSKKAVTRKEMVSELGRMLRLTHQDADHIVERHVL